MIEKKTQKDHIQFLDDIEKLKEGKENKQRHLSGIEKQITEQGEKIFRADKSLRKAQKDIQDICIIKEDDTMLLQQVRL